MIEEKKFHLSTQSKANTKKSTIDVQIKQGKKLQHSTVDPVEKLWHECLIILETCFCGTVHPN